MQFRLLALVLSSLTLIFIPAVRSRPAATDSIVLAQGLGGNRGPERFHRNQAAPSVAAQGTITIGDNQTVGTLDPLSADDQLDGDLDALLWSPLWTWDQNSQPVAILAQNIPTAANGEVSSDGRTVTIHLQPGLRWSDGQPLTSADILFGWQVEMNSSTGPWCHGTCDAISSIDTPDAITAVLHYSSPTGTYLEDMALPLPQHAFASTSAAASIFGQADMANESALSSVTSGPFQVLQPGTYDNVFTRNPYYSATVGPYVQRIVIESYSSAETEMEGLATGDVNLATDFSVAQGSQLDSLFQEDPGIHLAITPGFGSERAFGK